MKNNKRENAFDFLRLFASLTVVVGHSVDHFETPFFWYNHRNPFWFSDGVPMFFVISGLLVYKSCEKAFIDNRPLRHYFVNRFLRIAPALYVYLFVTTISLFLFGVISVDQVDIGFYAWFVSTIILFPVYHPSIFEDFGTGVVNGSLWTIPAEFSFYLVLPLFVWLKQKQNFSVMITLMLSVSVISIIFYNFMDHKFTGEEPLWFKVFFVSFLPYLLYFTIGVLLGKIWYKIPNSFTLATLSLVAYVLIRYEILFDKNYVDLVWEILWVLPFGYFIVWFGYNAPVFFYKFTNKIGDISYGVYIWHMVVVNYFMYYGLSEKLSGNLSNSLVLVISIILGLLSSWLVEKQALKFKPYNTRKEQFVINEKAL